MSPWIVCGQTTMEYDQRILNPRSSSPGIVGLAMLPYRVPDRMRLCITGYGVEAYDVPGTVALMPYIGEAETDEEINDAAILTAATSEVGTVFIDTKIWVPSGQTVNVCLMNGQKREKPFVYSWQIMGDLHVDSADTR